MHGKVNTTTCRKALKNYSNRFGAFHGKQAFSFSLFGSASYWAAPKFVKEFLLTNLLSFVVKKLLKRSKIDKGELKFSGHIFSNEKTA